MPWPKPGVVMSATPATPSPREIMIESQKTRQWRRTRKEEAVSVKLMMQVQAGRHGADRLGRQPESKPTKVLFRGAGASVGKFGSYKTPT
eukprot:scaffold17400_cov110-Isochrysis_galbana.AAC.2